jgi:hypothetical protein
MQSLFSPPLYEFKLTLIRKNDSECSFTLTSDEEDKSPRKRMAKSHGVHGAGNQAFAMANPMNGSQ